MLLLELMLTKTAVVPLPPDHHEFITHQDMDFHTTVMDTQYIIDLILAMAALLDTVDRLGIVDPLDIREVMEVALLVEEKNKK